MKSITFSTGEFIAEKTSAWLVSFIQFGKKIEALSLFEKVKLKMKEVDYTVHQKVLTLLLSVVVGCRYTSDINHKLVPDKVAAQMLGMSRFPDQSQINEVLRRADESNVNQLQSIMTNCSCRMPGACHPQSML